MVDLISDPILGKMASYRQWFEKRLGDAIQAADAQQSIEQQQRPQDEEKEKKKNGNSGRNGSAGKLEDWNNFTSSSLIILWRHLWKSLSISVAVAVTSKHILILYIG